MTLYAGTSSGAFTSTDGGASWTPASHGLARAPIRAMAIAHGAGGTALFAGPYGRGVFTSVDGGATWTSVDDGLSDPFVNALSVDVSPAGATVYAGTYVGVFALG